MWILNILAAPSEVFIKIKNYSIWFYSYLIVSSGLVVVTLLHDVLNMELTGMTIFTAVLINFILLPCSWLLYAMYLYIFVYFSQMEKSIDFEKIFSLVISVNFIFVLGKLFDALFVKANIISNQSSINLQMLFTSQNEILSLFLGRVELFTIWFLFILAYGFSYITNFSKLKSYSIVLFGWLLGIFFLIGLTLMYGGPEKGIKINIG